VTDNPTDTPQTIMLSADAATARLQVIAWLAYPDEARAERAFEWLTWWQQSMQGMTVPMRPNRLNQRLASLDDRLRERLVAGGLFLAKARDHTMTQPPWANAKWHPDALRVLEAIQTVDPSSTRNRADWWVRKRETDDPDFSGEQHNFVRKLVKDSRPVLALAAGWIERGHWHPKIDLRAFAFEPRPDDEIRAVLKAADRRRVEIAADDRSSVRLEDMLRFAMSPV
jgi:hypothetical protein